MNTQKRLEFYYTDLEWSIADAKAKAAGYKSLPHYLTKKISELKEIADNLTKSDFVVNKIKSKRRVYYPTIPSKEILDNISGNLEISSSIIVSRFIINPLLEK